MKTTNKKARKVITYVSPSGEKIDLTPAEVREWGKNGNWPKDSRGQEFCSVYQGLH